MTIAPSNRLARNARLTKIRVLIWAVARDGWLARLADAFDRGWSAEAYDRGCEDGWNDALAMLRELGHDIPEDGVMDLRATTCRAEDWTAHHARRDAELLMKHGPEFVAARQAGLAVNRTVYGDTR